jgi:hypothetical protein
LFIGAGAKINDKSKCNFGKTSNFTLLLWQIIYDTANLEVGEEICLLFFDNYLCLGANI